MTVSQEPQEDTPQKICLTPDQIARLRSHGDEIVISREQDKHTFKLAPGESLSGIPDEAFIPGEQNFMRGGATFYVPEALGCGAWKKQEHILGSLSMDDLLQHLPLTAKFFNFPPRGNRPAIINVA